LAARRQLLTGLQDGRSPDTQCRCPPPEPLLRVGSPPPERRRRRPHRRARKRSPVHDHSRLRTARALSPRTALTTRKDPSEPTAPTTGPGTDMVLSTLTAISTAMARTAMAKLARASGILSNLRAHNAPTALALRTAIMATWGRPLAP